jgi:hypothetical protein
MAVVRALFIGLTGTILIGIVFIGFGLFKPDTSAEDSRTCREAVYLQGIYIDRYVNTPNESDYWIVQADFAQQLNDLSGRRISYALNKALVEDSVQINNSKKFLPVMRETTSVCG